MDSPAPSPDLPFLQPSVPDASQAPSDAPPSENDASTLSMFTAALESIDDAILIVNHAIQPVYANRKFSQLWRLPDSFETMRDAEKAMPLILDQLVDPMAFLAKSRELQEHPDMESLDMLVFKDGRIFERSSRPQRVGEQQIGRVFCYRDITERVQAERALQASDARFKRIAANIPGMLYQFVLEPDGSSRFPYVSEACRELFEVEPTALQENGALLISLIHPDDRRTFQQTLDESAGALTPWKWEGRYLLSSGALKWAEVLARPERQDDGSILWDGVLMDVTVRKQAEAALRRNEMQEQLLHAQAAILEELSTPLLPISDWAVVMPLIGTIDSQRAERVVSALLHGIETHRARIAILDITGVPVVDTGVANALIRAAQAVRLLGSEVVLTGIRPEVAQTLVGLGISLTDIVTRSSLQSGIAYAFARG